MGLKISPQHPQKSKDKDRGRKSPEHRDGCLLHEPFRRKKQKKAGDQPHRHHITQSTIKKPVRIAILTHGQFRRDQFGDCGGNAVGGHQKHNGIEPIGRLVIPQTQLSYNRSHRAPVEKPYDSGNDAGRSQDPGLQYEIIFFCLLITYTHS